MERVMIKWVSKGQSCREYEKQRFQVMLWQFWLRFCDSFAPKCGWIMLAQTFCVSCRSGGWFWFWARECLAQARRTRLSELVHWSCPRFVELSPRRRGARLSETLHPERRVGRGCVLVWCFLSYSWMFGM